MPARSSGSKTPPDNMHTATSTPASLDQTADLPAFPAHKRLRTGSNPTLAPHRPVKTPARLRKAWAQDDGPADDNAQVSRDDRFYPPRASRLSIGRRNGSGHQEGVLSSLGSPKATPGS